jgi:plasmid replication initiation protein
MKNELVVKDNALINASYNLEVTEQRLILLAIINARETGQGITADSKLEIHASDYATQFNVAKETAYEALKSAVNNLFERQFSFKEEHKNTGKTGIVRSRWVSRIKYVDELAVLEITFAPDVVPLITRLEQHFTSYQIKQVSQLTSKYGIRLYELLIMWRSVGKCLFSIDDLRFKFGIEPHEYKQMGHFKSRVLEPAIKQINEFTDITVSYEQKKTGRVISGFEFKFKLKNQPPKEKKISKDQNTIDMFTSMTPKQILLFAKKLAYDDQFGGRVGEVGESREDLERRLIDLLVEPKNLVKWADDLKRLGFTA